MFTALKFQEVKLWSVTEKVPLSIEVNNEHKYFFLYIIDKTDRNMLSSDVILFDCITIYSYSLLPLFSVSQTAFIYNNFA
jgi:hypothetical protein